MKLFAIATFVEILALGTVISCTAKAQSATAANQVNPVQHHILLELFTSEGCSSCPPADALLQQWDATQPLPGAQMIVLSEHVDYWDHDGWKDPYSSAALTDRQADYVRVMGLSSAYTPQVIVDGSSELQLHDSKQVSAVIEKTLAAPEIPVTLDKTAVTPESLQSHIEVDGTSAKHDADIYAAVALNHAESQVTKGENSGHHLVYVAVVQQIQKVGKLEKGKTFSKDIQLKLKPGTDPHNLRLIVFAQESGPGKVIGVAQQKLTE